MNLNKEYVVVRHHGRTGKLEMSRQAGELSC